MLQSQLRHYKWRLVRHCKHRMLRTSALTDIRRQDPTTFHQISIATPLRFRSNLQLFQMTNDKKTELENKANLGKMIEELQRLVPNLLVKSLPKDLISSEVLLRICPTHFDEFNALLPNIKGHVSYYTTLKSLQFVLTSLILNPKVKLHIQNIAIVPPQQSTIEYLCVYPHTTKIQIRWTTCSDGCHHLTEENPTESSGYNVTTRTTSPPGPDGSTGPNSSTNSTSSAMLGSHSWSQLDPKPFYNYHNSETAPRETKSLLKTLNQLTSGFIGLVKTNNDLERVISGIFIFELNHNNTQILVHTIEEVNIVENQEPLEVSGLRIC